MVLLYVAKRLWEAHLESDKDLRADRDDWKQLALRGTDIAETVVKKRG